MELKTCAFCKEQLPATTDYFWKCKRASDGLNWRCKNCVKIYEQQKYERHREKKLQQVKDYYENNKEKILDYQVNYYEKNKKKVNERNKKYRQVNNEKIREHQRLAYQREKPIRRIKARKYRNTPKGRQVELRNKHTRRNRMINSISTLTLKDWQEALNFFNNECAYCGLKTKLQQEHVIPVSKGGHYNKQNIIPACKSCNSRKNDILLEDWYPKQSSFTKKRMDKIYKWMNVDKKNNQQQIALF